MTWTAHGAVIAPLSCDSPAASSPGFTQRTQQPSTFSSALTISFPLCTPAWFPLPHIAQDSPMRFTPTHSSSSPPLPQPQHTLQLLFLEMLPKNKQH